MSSVALLLSPLWLSWKNSLGRSGGSWPRRLLLAGLAIGFWIGTYLVIRRVLRYFETVFDLGPGLAYQLLLIILLTFLSMLLFSNLVASLSTYFLARDLDLVHATPISRDAFFFARLIQTTVNSSWMVLFFSLPIFAAYGSVFGGGWVLYVWIGLILPLFLIIPAALGIVITHLLVYFLPAKRIRDVLFFIGLIAFVVMFFLFRFSQPERLVQPESFGNFMQFLSAMETPSSPFLPSSWSADILAGTLFNRETEQGFFFALLASYALFLPVAASWISGAVYFEGWSKAQESRQGRRKFVWFDRLLDAATRLFPETTRAIMIKDIKTFLRDTTQWSQLFLLLALIVVYLYNFKVLPLDRSPMPAGTLRTLVSFANLGASRFRPQRRRRPLCLSGDQLGRKGFLDFAELADFSARFAVEQVLADFRTAALARRTARVPEQSPAPRARLDDGALPHHGLPHDLRHRRHRCRSGRTLSKFQLRQRRGNPDQLRRCGGDDPKRRFHRACGRHRSLADLSVGHGVLAPGPRFSAAPRAHRAIADHGCGFDGGGGNAVIATRHKTTRAAKRLTATSGGHSCSSFTHCINRPATDRFQPF